MKILERLDTEIHKLKDEDLYRKLKSTSGLVDFCSNDYLGISNGVMNGLIKLPFHDLATGSGGSRLLAGNYPEIEQLECLLAKVHNQERALVFNSGYSANLGFFSAVPNKNSVVIYDSKIHACIKDGMRLSFAQKSSFNHNNLSHLKKRLENVDGKEAFVVVESVYSMDGDEAPLKEIVALCEHFGAYLVVDEAHTTGVYGENGAGLISQLGLDEKVFAKIHTFGKGIGAHGACVVGKSSLIDYLVNKSRPFIYTTAMPVHAVETLLGVYGYLSSNYKLCQTILREKIELFKNTISQKGILSNSPIQVVLIPGNKEARQLANSLQKRGYDVRPVLSPTVKAGEERLRVCIHTFNTDQEIIDLAKTINDLR